MKNQSADHTEQNSSVTPSNIDKSSNKCLVACPIFRRELESVLEELGSTPTINYMDYTVHSTPLRMEKELQDNAAKVAGTGKELRFLVGRQCKAKRDIEDIVKDCSGKIPQEKNCIEMLIGEELAEKLQKNRTSLMTPAWIRMINQSIADGNWSVTDARLNLGWYNKILILDTGVDPLSDEQIMEFYDLTQVEIDILQVDLEHFKGLLQELLE